MDAGGYAEEIARGRVRAAVPEEVGALRERLEQLRRNHTSPSVLAAINAASRALDDLGLALLREHFDADTARRLGPR
jgi:hypothetical protein